MIVANDLSEIQDGKYQACLDYERCYSNSKTKLDIAQKIYHHIRNGDKLWRIYTTGCGFRSISAYKAADLSQANSVTR